MESDNLEMVVQLAEQRDGFREEQGYMVFAQSGELMLLVNDSGRFDWVPANQLSPLRIQRGERVLFDRQEFLTRRRFEPFVGHEVLLTTWEDLGLPVEQHTEDAMLVYRVRVEGFEGQLLMVTGGEGLRERSGVMVGQIYDMRPVGEPAASE